MFKSVSRSLALQFTGFVVLLVLINGATFIVADYQNTQRLMDGRLFEDSHRILESLPYPFTQMGVITTLPPHIRDRVRVLDAHENPIYVGSFFISVPMTIGDQQFMTSNVMGEGMRIFTAPVFSSGSIVGYVQVGTTADVHPGDLPDRILVFLFTTAFISILTYLVGLYFSRRSLKPAEEMFERLEQFTQDASHELRTPLAVLGSSLDVAMKTGKHKEGIESAKEDLKQISKLVERLLELTRLDRFTLEKKDIALSDLVEDTVSKFTLLAEKKHLTLSAKIDPAIHVYGDEALVRQVLTNLLSNALKFNVENGSVHVKLTKNFLIISDTGVGIPTEDLANVFDRFYQADTSRSNDGLGLGLALVKRIIVLHRWKIGVESAPGTGTTFTIFFS